MSCLKDYLLLFAGIFHSVVSLLDLAASGRLPIPSACDATCAAPCQVQIAFSRPPPLALLTRGGFPARPCRCTFGRELNCSFACCRQHLSVRIALTFKLLLAL